MKLSISAALIIVIVFGGFDLWLWRHYHSPAATLVAVGALGVACYAQLEASRSAHNSRSAFALAQLNDDRAKYGWQISVDASANRYILRNMGTSTAHDVRFVNVDSNTHFEFEQHEGERGPTVRQGDAVAFHVMFMYGSRGNAVEFDWLPEGEAERRTFKDVLDNIPNTTIDERVRRREAEREAGAAMDRVWCAEIRTLLIELASAWGDFETSATPQNRMRVQALVSALPTNMVRAIGFAVDVPRDFWGNQQWPLEDFVRDERDKTLVRENAPMIELIWNLGQVQIPRVREEDLSQPPQPWYRIEHAVTGYVELVRNREQGIVEFRDGERDRRSQVEAERMFKQAEVIFNSKNNTEDNSPDAT